MGREACLGFLNWVAPGGLKNSTRECQSNILSCLLSQSDTNVGCVLTPEFTYKKGQLWMVETSVLRQLAMSGTNVDRQFTLGFKEKVSLPNYVNKHRRPCECIL